MTLFLLYFRKWRLSHKLPPYVAEELPAVSILKPLVGVDPHLYENLETFFKMKYPQVSYLGTVTLMELFESDVYIGCMFCNLGHFNIKSICYMTVMLVPECLLVLSKVYMTFMCVAIQYARKGWTSG